MGKTPYVKTERCNEWCDFGGNAKHNKYCAEYYESPEFFAGERKALARESRTSRYTDKYELYPDGVTRLRRVGSHRSRPAIGLVHKGSALDKPGVDKPDPAWGLDGRSRGEVMRDYWIDRTARRQHRG